MESGFADDCLLTSQKQMLAFDSYYLLKTKQRLFLVYCHRSFVGEILFGPVQIYLSLFIEVSKQNAIILWYEVF